MADNLVKRKRGGKRERGTPRPPVKEEPAPPLLTYEEYERTKRILLQKAVLSEQLYIKFRTQLRDNKLKELEEYKAAVATKTCPEYLAGKKDAEEALAKKMNVNQVRYEMKIAQIKDEYEAEVDMASRSYEDQYQYNKHRYIDFMKEIIAEKEQREKDVGNILAALLTLPPLPDPTTERPIFKEDETNQREVRQTRSQSKSK